MPPGSDVIRGTLAWLSSGASELLIPAYTHDSLLVETHSGKSLVYEKNNAGTHWHPVSPERADNMKRWKIPRSIQEGIHMSSNPGPLRFTRDQNLTVEDILSLPDISTPYNLVVDNCQHAAKKEYCSPCVQHLYTSWA